MAVRIHDTLSGREDELVPVAPDGTIRMYVCGMTPKFHPHVGHARTFVAMDVIRRYLQYRGYTVRFVQNFTDIDDKIIDRANREESDAASTAQRYIDSYFEVMDRLHIRRADDYPRVTEYIERIVEFTAGLVEAGHAYATPEGDVWFNVASDPDYGKLSKRDLNSQLVGARKDLEPGKRDPRDFALWKAAKPDEPSWPSPWGRGRPGWHIECSTMSRETLGDQLDIHGGGSDLIFPHHENEIAQSESLTGVVPFTRFWTHTGAVTINDEKMAHSLENFFTIADVMQRYTPDEVRYYLTAVHYRTNLSFAMESLDDDGHVVVRGLEEARTALGRMARAVGDAPLDPNGELDQAAIQAFTAAMDDDFNTPAALAVIADLRTEVNRLRDAAAPADQMARAGRTMVHLLDVLGIQLPPLHHSQSLSAGPYINLLLEIRQKLRQAKQFALADEVRLRLEALGIEVQDQSGGVTTWRPRQ